MKTKMIKSALLLIVSLYANLLLNEAFSQTATLVPDCETISLEFTGAGAGHWESPGLSDSDYTNFESTLTTVNVSSLPPNSPIQFTWVLDGGGSATTPFINTHDDASASFSAGVDINVCNGATQVNLAANLPGGYTGLWTVLDGPVSPFVLDTDPTTLADIQDGFNRFEWTVTNADGCTASDIVEINSAPVNATITDGNLMAICDTFYTLNAQDPGDDPPYTVSTILWKHLGANPLSEVVVGSPNALTTNISGLDRGSNKFRLVVDNGFCSDSAEIDIRVDLPTQPKAGNDTVICSDEYILKGNTPAPINGGVGVWTSDGVANIIDENSANTLVTDLGHYVPANSNGFLGANGTINTFYWTITYTHPDGHSCFLQDQVDVINLNPFPANAGPDQTVCGDRANLNATCHGSGAMYTEWYKSAASNSSNFWHPRENPLLSDSAEFNTIVTDLEEAFAPGAENWFVWHKWNELTYNGYYYECHDRDTVDITAIQGEFNTEGLAGNDRVICSSEEILAAVYPSTADVPNASGEWSIIESGFNTVDEYSTIQFANATSNSTTVTGLYYGYNILRWTITDLDNNCTFDDDLYLYNATGSQAEIPPFTADECVSWADLSARNPDIGEGYWTWTTPPGNTGFAISDPSCQNQTCNVYVSGMTRGQYSFTWNVDNTYTDAYLNNNSVVCHTEASITISNKMVTPNAGPDQFICSDQVSLTGSKLDIGSGELWGTNGQWTMNNTDLVTSFSSSSLVKVWDDNVATGYNLNRTTPTVFVWTEWTVDPLDPNNHICSNSDEVVINNNLPSDAIITNPSDPLYITCNGSAQLTAQNLGLPDDYGVWSVENSPVGVTISNTTTEITDVSGVEVQGTETFIWTAYRPLGNGTDSLCQLKDEISIYNNQVTASTPPHNNVCGDAAGGTVSTNIMASGNNFEFGVWSSTEPNSATTTIIDANSTFSEVTGITTEGTYTYQWKVWREESGVTCYDSTEQSFKVIVPELAQITPPNVFEICGDTAALLANLPSAGFGSWSIGNSSITIDNVSAYETVARGLSNAASMNEQKFVWTINEDGCFSRDTLTVLSHGVKAFAHDGFTGEDTIVCADYFNLNATDISEYNAEYPDYLVQATGKWTAVPSTVLIDDDTQTNAFVPVLPSTSVRFIWTVTKGGCVAKDTIVVDNESFTITAGGPYETCDGTIMQMNGTPPGGTPFDGYFGIWEQVGGNDATILSPGSYNTAIEDIPIPHAFFRWTVTRNGCSAYDDATVVNNTIVAIPGDPINSCADTAILDAVAAPFGVWSLSSGDPGIIIDNSLSNETVVRNLPLGPAIFKWKVTKGICSDSAELEVNNYELHAEASNVIACKMPERLTGNNPNDFYGASGYWDVDPVDIGKITFIDDPSIFNAQIDDVPKGSYIGLTWNLENAYCHDSKSIDLVNNSFEVFAGNDEEICDNEFELNVTLSSGTGYWEAVLGPAIFDNSTDPGTTVRNLRPGENKLRWNVIDNGCHASDDVIITNNSFNVSAGSNKTICENYTTLSGTPLSDGATGIWKNETGQSYITIDSPGSEVTDVTGLIKGFYKFSWTVTKNDCPATAFVDITSNYFEADAGPDERTVTIDNTIMTAALPAGATGTWSSMGAATVVSVNDPATAVNNLQFGSNIFQWHVEWDGCESDDFINIIYNSLVADAGTGGIVCEDRITLNAVLPAQCSGKWEVIEGKGTFVNDTDPDTDVYGIEENAINTYRWTITREGVSASADVSYDNRQFPIEAGLDRDICEDTLTLAGQNKKNATGVWSVIAPGNATFADPSLYNTFVYDIQDGPNKFVWMVTSPWCTNSDTLIVTYHQPPDANFITDKSEGCSPIDVLYTNTSSGGTEFTWIFDDDGLVNQTGLGTVNRTYEANSDQDMIYTTTLIAYSSAGCSDTISKQITVFKTPLVNFDAYPKIQIYPGVTVNFQNQSRQTYDEYYWDYGDGSNQIDNEFVPVDRHVYQTWGEYLITLRAKAGECESTASQLVKIVAPEPEDKSTENRFGGCNPFAMNFEAKVAYADTFLWKFGDFEASSNLENPSYIYDRTGRFYVDLWAGGPGTDGELIYIRRDTIDVYPTPFADFNPLPKTVLLPNQPIYCNNLTLDGEFYTWDFGDDSEVSTDPDPSHYYTKAGIYNISLKVYTENKCFDDTTINEAVTVLEPGFVKFPSAFKPNPGGPSDGTWTRRDEANDIFHPVHRGVEEYKLEIFNRWGEKVFESNDPSIGWDGYIDGKLASQDVYVWKVSGKYINGVLFKKTGDLTLIR